MSLTPEERNLSEFSIKYTPYSIQDHYAILHLAKVHNTSRGMLVKMAVHEWLEDNFIKEIEFAQAVQEITNLTNDSGQT